MNHLEAYQYEVHVPIQERDWLNWAARVENSLGHSLDGDLSENGFSMDRAYSTFLLGVSSLEYSREVKARNNYKPL